jgi:fatty acid-binding protein DegV
MKKIALIVDSSSGIKNGQYPHVYVLPMIITEQQGSNIISYRDGVDITVNQLSSKLEAGADIKTSQANVKEMFDLVESVKKDYEKVFVLPIPSTISGNYNS